MNISKELLSAVLGETVLMINGIEENELWFVSAERNFSNKINIYELQHKMKEWAKTKGWSINSNLKYCWAMSIECADEDYDIEGLGKHTEQADTEPEAIFKAGEWVLKEISK